MENKKRLIYADDAVKLLRGKCVAKYPSTFLMGLFASADEISKMPTVDAVEVVRCKDCKHKGWIQEPCHGKSVDYCRVLDFCINNADKCFCSYGERRKEE